MGAGQKFSAAECRGFFVRRRRDDAASAILYETNGGGAKSVQRQQQRRVPVATRWPRLKSHAFDVTVPAGTPVDAIIAAAAAIVSLPEVYAVQHLGGPTFQVVVNSRQAAASLGAAREVIIADQAIPMTPVGPVITSITCMFLPLFVSDETLKKSLEPYGQILEITHGVYKDNPSVKTGIRYLKMKMKEDNPVPNFARIAGYRVTFDYRGLGRSSKLRIRDSTNDDGLSTTSNEAVFKQHASGRTWRRLIRRTDAATPPRRQPVATSASEPDQSPTQAPTPSRANLEGLGYGPWSTAGEEEDGASTDSEALVIDEEAPEDRKTFLESYSFSSTVSSKQKNGSRNNCTTSHDACPLTLLRDEVLALWQNLSREAGLRRRPVVNAYADDITVYVQDCDSLRRVWRIFDAYAAISGAALNFNKCHGISLGQITRKPTVKILGVWFNANGASRKTWSNIYHAMEAEVEKLERFQVPLFERRHFAHSVLCGSAWYVARTIPSPRKTALRLQRLLTEFFWNHKTALVAAPVLSLAREQGG
ncbi:hypothetical protein HPB47_003350, partial [Ixodes persulcatus]